MVAVWVRLRDEIRQQRGRNQFRGSEVHLLPKQEVRIPVELRGGYPTGSEVVIHLSDLESELWAIQRPEGKRLHIQDFDFSLSSFVAAILEICRGKEYLHTNSKSAAYRKGEENGNDE